MKTAAKQAAAENQKALLTFTVTMAALPDGTRYPGSTVLSIPPARSKYV